MTESERDNYTYLGDGVYAFFHEGSIVLRTGNHDHVLCDNEIYLEPETLDNLNKFYNKKIGK